MAMRARSFLSLTPRRSCAVAPALAALPRGLAARSASTALLPRRGGLVAQRLAADAHAGGSARLLVQQRLAHHRGGASTALVVRRLASSSSAAAAAAGSSSKEIAKKAAAPPPARWSPSWMWLHLKETALHYYHGSKLLAADTRIAAKLLRRMVAGRNLSRREHNLLVRVCADIARLVPLLFFLLVPMMEFALPFAIRLFPNLLPSTFEERHQREEKQKKLLKVRMEMAQLMRHTD